MTAAPLPPGPLVSWYGDDFTGSSAVMEAMTLAGLPAVLFFDAPTAAQLAKFADYRGIGMAGVARAQGPAWMEAHLPRFYEAMAKIGAPVAQYKICSTLDSSPDVGSIGKALEIALRIFDNGNWIPFITAAPPLGRYQLFANLFAAVNGVGHRLDRHPVMSRHPVTPMHEADVRLHLAKQTDIAIGLVDYPTLRAGRGTEMLARELAAGKRIVTLDVIEEESLADAGQLIWEQRGGKPIFTIGSQGIEYALAAYFRRTGALAAMPPAPRAAKAERVAVVSGSCSPITAAQIAWAEDNSFAMIRLDPRLAMDAMAWKGELARVTDLAIAAMGQGQDPLIFSAKGPDDPAVGAFFEAVKTRGADAVVVNEAIGKGFGTVLDALIRKTKLKRGIIAGGDTSSYGAQELNIYALTLLAATLPGASLYKAHSDDPAFADFEIALKGGQMGAPQYFGHIKDGGLAA